MHGHLVGVRRREIVPNVVVGIPNVSAEFAWQRRQQRAGRKWQIACVSESVSGLQAAVFAGMAITVLGRCALVTGMRELTPAETDTISRQIAVGALRYFLLKFTRTAIIAFDGLFAVICNALGI